MSNSFDPMDCDPPGSSVHGLLQARILEWVAIPFSREIFPTRIEPGSPALWAESSQSELQERYFAGVQPQWIQGNSKWGWSRRPRKELI